MLVQKLMWQGMAGRRSCSTRRSATHILLGLWAFYERRHFGWTRTEVVQLVLGLSIPPLLMQPRLFVTRISLDCYGTQKGYAQELYRSGSRAELGVQQVAVLIVAWIHGCIGVYFSGCG